MAGWALPRAIGNAAKQQGTWIMFTFALRMMREERGATAIEYALIAGGIALAIIAAVNAVGITLEGKFQDVHTKLSGM